jgi:hypothetical protein
MNVWTLTNAIKYHLFHFRLLAETKPLVILTAHRRCEVVDIPPVVKWRTRTPMLDTRRRPKFLRYVYFLP